MKFRKVLAIAAVLSLGSFRASAFPSADDNSVATIQASTTVGAAGATNSADFVNYSWSGVLLTVDVTTITGTAPTLTVKVQEKDVLSGKYVDLQTCTTPAIANVRTVTLQCYPGIVAATVTTNVTASIAVPRSWRVVSTAGGTPSNITWTIGAQLLK